MREEIQKTILLVEDEVIIAMSEKISLEKYGYKVVVVNAGEDAIRTVDDNSNVDLILMDIDLGGGIDGTEVARIILSNHDLPIVFLSSHTEPDIVRKTELITSYGYVVKNSGITVLDASIKMAFRLFNAKTEILTSEEKFSKAFNISPSSITIASMNDSKFVEVNDVFLETTGYLRDEVIGHTALELDIWVDIQDRNRFIQELQTNGFIDDTEFRYRMKNKEIRDFVVSSEIIEVEGTRCSLNYILDITERKSVERKLLESEANFRAIFEKTSTGYIVLSVEGILLKINKAMADMIGYTVDEMLSSDFRIITHPDDIRKSEENIRTLLSGEQETVQFEKRYLHKNGQIVWAYINTTLVRNHQNVPQYFITSVTNITDRKEVEFKSRTATLLLEKTFEQSPVPMVLVSMPDAILRIVNPAADRFLGIEDESSKIGMSLLDISPSWKDLGVDGTPGEIKDLPLARSIMGMKTESEERRIIRKDGTECYELVSAAPIRNENGDVIAGFLTMMDITDRKMAEEKIRNKNQELEELNEELTATIEEMEAANDALVKTGEELMEKDRTLVDEQKFVESLFDSIAGFLYVCDEQSNLIRWNRNLETITGYSGEELSRMTLSRLFDDDRGEIQLSLQSGHGTGHGETTVRLLTKDGRKPLMSVKCVTLEINGRRYFAGSGMDGTERKKAENVFDRDAFFMNSIMEYVPINIYFKDKESRFIRISRELAEKFGLSDPADAVGKTDFDYFEEDNARSKMDDERRVIETGEMLSKIEKEVFPGKEDIWVSTVKLPLYDTNKIMIGSFGISKDITEQIQTRDALRMKTMFLEAIANSIIDGILVVDQFGKKILQNQRTIDLWKIPKHIVDDPDGMNQARYVMNMTKNPEQFIMGINSQRGNPIAASRGELELIDGTVLERYSAPVIGFDGMNYGTIWTFHDVTERSQMMKALARQEFLMNSMMENVTDYVYFKDRESRYIKISRSLALKYGMSDQADAVGKSDFDFYHETNARQKYEDEQEIIRTGQSVSKEEREIRNGHPEIWVSSTKMPMLDLDGNIVGTFGISEDITERRHAEEALRLKTVFLEAIANTSCEGILVVNPQGRKILQNQRCIELWKIPQNVADDDNDEQQVAHVMKMTKTPDAFVEKIVYLYSHPEETSTDEVELIDGTVLDRYSAPVMGLDGQYFGRIWTFHDITSRKMDEMKIRALLDEKELILKEVHHRIKNNMHAISSLLAMQAVKLEEPQAIMALDDASSRIQSMMLLYTKLYQSADFNSVSVRNYIPHLVDEIVLNYPHEMVIKVETLVDDFILDAKRLQSIGIIINELITNMMKYAFVDKSEGLILVSAYLKENTVSLSIGDNGGGMPEPIDYKSSAGFGLRLVEMLTRQLNGSLRIEHGMGTRIIIEFKL
jgi:PAS domain S-box-containing protein